MVWWRNLAVSPCYSGFCEERKRTGEDGDRGAVAGARRARVRVPGVEVDVRIEDVGVGPSGLREDVDDAYRAKYGGGSTGNMVSDRAAATTLRLLRT